MQYEYRALTAEEQQSFPHPFFLGGLVACARRVKGETVWWLHYCKPVELTNVSWIS